MRIPLVVASLMLLAAGSQAKTLYVPGQYASLQNAVNAAEPGDTIAIASGVYHENVVVGVTNIKLTGYGNAIVDGTGLSGSGITIVADGATVSGITVRNFNRLDEYSDFGVGIFVNGVVSATITNCTLTGNDYGLWTEGLYNSDIWQTHNVTNNRFVNNLYYGAYIRYIDGQTNFTGNTVNGNGEMGAAIDTVNGLRIASNEFGGNALAVDPSFLDPTFAGLSVSGSIQSLPSVITGNNLHDNGGSGLILYGDAGTTACGNQVYNNGWGIDVFAGYQVAVSGNMVFNNKSQGLESHGIFLNSFTTETTVTGNLVLGNGGDGIAVFWYYDFLPDPDSVDNQISGNISLGNGAFDVADETGFTWNTVLNTWRGNLYRTYSLTY